jgi:hypothetical protein
LVDVSKVPRGDIALMVETAGIKRPSANEPT